MDLPRTIQRFQRFAITRCLGGWRNYRRTGYVVIFHIGRTGSTVLGNLLSQQSSIGWGGELFQPHLRKYAQDDLTLRSIPPVNPMLFLRDRAARTHLPLYGFELKFFHLRVLGMNPESFLRELNQTQTPVHIIVLQRRNLLRKVVSGVIAKNHNILHLPQGSTAKPNPVNIDVNAVFVDRQYRALLDVLDEYTHDFAQLKTLLSSSEYLELYYEGHIMPDPLIAYRLSCQHLNLNTTEANITLQRVNPFPLSQLIENFDEVRAHLATTPYAWMTDD